MSNGPANHLPVPRGTFWKWQVMPCSQRVLSWHHWAWFSAFKNLIRFLSVARPVGQRSLLGHHSLKVGRGTPWSRSCWFITRARGECQGPVELLSWKSQLRGLLLPPLRPSAQGAWLRGRTSESALCVCVCRCAFDFCLCVLNREHGRTGKAACACSACVLSN